MGNVDLVFMPLIVLAGFAAGFINTLAGSGSLITLSLLTLLGIPSPIANGSNRVGVVVQNLVALESFRRQKVVNIRHGLLLSAPAIVGSLVGAQIAVNLNEEMMDRTLGALMIAMLFIIMLRPNRWLEGKEDLVSERLTWSQGIILFLVGIYGGFIQAGVGIFILATLVLGIGYDLVRANGVKVLIIFSLTMFALAVFVLNDQVWWDVGILLAIGNAFGGWIAARMAVEKGAGFVRWVLIVVVAASAANLFGVFDWIGRLFM